MAYRHGNREQISLLPSSVEDYVKLDDPVRAYDAVVESMDFEELGIVIDEGRVGNPQYNPKAMLKLLVYGYSYGIRSSRKLERAVHHNLSFIWLTGALEPDHKTIAEFRRKNKGAIKKVLKACARICLKLDLVAGNTLFVDSTKIRANASIKNSWTKEKCKKALKKIDRRIQEVLADCDHIDAAEDAEPSYVKMQEELKDHEALKGRVQNILAELRGEDKKSVNTTDGQCTRVNSLDGSHAGYNMQNVVDEKHGLIVSSDVVAENNDLKQFANQIEKAEDVLERQCQVASADSGYATTDQLKIVVDRGIKVVVPSQRQAADKEIKPFDKENFIYDEKRDLYICPEGKHLTYRRLNKKKRYKVYRIRKKSYCRGCVNYGSCTRSKNGRVLTRLLNEDVRRRLEAQFLEDESQKVYKLRQQKVELPFGHIKRNLGVNSFLLRGLDGVRAEASLLSSCFNISRMITLFGVSGLIERLMG